MGQWSKKGEVDSASAPNFYIRDSANLENYAWICVYKDDWDEEGVLLEIWFLPDYDIQIHCFEKLINFRMVFLKVP